MGAEDTLTVLVLENRRLCAGVPDEVFWELAAQVGSPLPHSSTLAGSVTVAHQLLFARPSVEGTIGAG